MDFQLFSKIFFLFSFFLLGQPAMIKKFCGNEACTEKLFTSKVRRVIKSSHESFLSVQQDDEISVYAIKFNDRNDLLEGAASREPEKKGAMFISEIDTEIYLNFLTSAIVSNKTMFVIGIDPNNPHLMKTLGTNSADPELRVILNHISNESEAPVDIEKFDDKSKITEDVPVGHGHPHMHLRESANSHSHDSAHHHSGGQNQALPLGKIEPTEKLNQLKETNLPAEKIERPENPASQHDAKVDNSVNNHQASIKEKMPTIDPLYTGQANAVPNSDPSIIVSDIETVAQVQIQDPHIVPLETTHTMQASKIEVPSAISHEKNQTLQASEVKMQPTVSPDVKMQPTVSPEVKMQPTVSPDVKMQTTVSPEVEMQLTVSPEVKMQTTVSPEVEMQPTVSSEVEMQPTVSPEVKVQPIASFETAPTLQASEVKVPSTVSSEVKADDVQLNVEIKSHNPPTQSNNGLAPNSLENVSNIRIVSTDQTAQNLIYKNGEEKNNVNLHELENVSRSSSGIKDNDLMVNHRSVMPNEGVQQMDAKIVSPPKVEEKVGQSKVIIEDEIERYLREENLRGKEQSTSSTPVSNIPAQESISTEQQALKTPLEPAVASKSVLTTPPLDSILKTSFIPSQDTVTASPRTEQNLVEVEQSTTVPSNINFSTLPNIDLESLTSNPAKMMLDEPKNSVPDDLSDSHLKNDGDGALKVTRSLSDLPDRENGFCDKDGGCEAFSGKIPIESGDSSAKNVTSGWLRKITSIIRYAIPFFETVDDAGIVVTLFVPISLIIYFIRYFLLLDSSGQETFDRETFHDTLTALREKDEQIKLLRVDIEKARTLRLSNESERVSSLEMELGKERLILQQMRNKCHALEDENENLQSTVRNMEEKQKSEAEYYDNLENDIRQLKKSNEMLNEQITEMQSTMECARDKSDKLEDEVNNKNEVIKQLEGEIRSHIVDVQNFKDQCEIVKKENNVLREQVKSLENDVIGLLTDLNKKKETKYGENSLSVVNHQNSSAENDDGWSDFGDFDIDTAENKAAKYSLSDIYEAAKIRAQLKKVEGNLEQARLSLEKEESMREHLLRKVELAESEATERKRELEVKEQERIETQHQCRKMLTMVEDRDAKIKNSEELIERLREDVSKWQTEIGHLIEQRKHVEKKLIEAEQELKKLKSESAHRETRHFHEIRDFQRKMCALQQSLESQNLSNPLVQMDSLNASGNSSSDHDYKPISRYLNVMSNKAVPTLWGDSEIFSTNVDLPNRKISDEFGSQRFPFSKDEIDRQSTRSRRSNKDRSRISPDPGGQRLKKEGRRMRSKSHGRSNLPSVYSSHYPSFPDLSLEAASNRHHSKSGGVYYSSGGSNEGFSPPPELALLPGIPPPSSVMITRPTPLSRPLDKELLVRHNN